MTARLKLTTLYINSMNFAFTWGRPKTPPFLKTCYTAQVCWPSSPLLYHIPICFNLYFWRQADMTTTPPIPRVMFTHNPRGVLRHGGEIGPSNDITPGLKGRLYAPLTNSERAAVEHARRVFINVAACNCRLGKEEFDMFRSNASAMK